MNLKLSARLKFIAGILLMILNAAIWINGLFIHRERGMDIVSAVPLLYIGAFLLLGWYKTSVKPQPSKSHRWKFMLSVLLINYLVLYFIYMISDIIFWAAIDFLGIPGNLSSCSSGSFYNGIYIILEK